MLCDAVSLGNLLDGGFNQIPCIDCGLRTLICKLTDLVCNDCKAASRLACPCSLDGSVE